MRTSSNGNEWWRTKPKREAPMPPAPPDRKTKIVQRLKQARALFGMALAAPFVVIAQLAKLLYAGCNVVASWFINHVGKVRIQMGGVDMQEGKKFEDDPAVIAARRGAPQERYGVRPARK